MDRLFLLDAYALIYRSYYALIRSPRINSKGLNTSAIMGFCNTLVEVLQKERPTHIGVAFDPAGPTFRHEAFADYKAQREATPEDIRRSVPIIKELLGAWRIPVLEAPGFEADDVIGTLAHKAAAEGIDVYMLTPDKDYGQLVAPGVTMMRPRTGQGGFELLGPEEVKAKYSIDRPEQVIDLLGLMGDAADNIPGCPGVGEKTAAKLIAQFGGIDGLLANTSQLKGALKQKVEDNAEQIRFSRYLATIRTDAPIELRLDELAVKEPDESELTRMLTELEFASLAKRLFKKSETIQTSRNSEPDLFAFFAPEGTENQKSGLNLSLKSVTHTYHLVDNETDMQEICDFFRTKKNISFDTETTSTNAHEAELVGLSFCVEPGEAYYVPVSADPAAAQRVVDIFRPIYEDEAIEKTGQNIKYDLEVLARYGVRLKGPLWDTMIAHYLIQPELRHNMDYMAEAYLGYQTIHIDELIGPRGKGQRSMRDVAPEDVCDYAAEDADITLQLRQKLEPELERIGATRLFKEVEMPLVRVLADMELHGVRIDTDSLADTSRLLTGRMHELEQRIYERAGGEFNIASPKQVGEVLFDRLRIAEKPKRTKTGQYVTSEEVLQQLSPRHEIVADILAHRGLKKLLGTYVDALPRLINPRTGRIHTSFNQTVTATGRLSSSDPNLQNIPVRGEDGKEIRRAFVPEPGCLFFSADYSQIELRVMAHLSGDENMIEAFREGHDIHAATAAKIYGEAIDSVSRDQRTKAKRANFGIIYGITTFGLAERLAIPRDEARQLIDGYFATFPKVAEYMDKAKDEARSKGYVETLMHRRRYLPDINSRNATVRGFAERNAINAPIQGTAADIIKLAMVRIHERFEAEGIRSKMILQVHDELNFSVIPEEKEAVERIVIGEMQAAMALNVPLIADCGWGENWLEAH